MIRKLLLDEVHHTIEISPTSTTEDPKLNIHCFTPQVSAFIRLPTKNIEEFIVAIRQVAEYADACHQEYNKHENAPPTP